MAVESGPDIVTNGLVLSLDAGNLRSYPGDATTNLVSSATAMSSWTAYYRTTAAPTFTTEFGTTGYRFVNQPSWNGVYRNFNLGSAGTYTFSAWFRFWGGSANNNGATVYVSNYGGGDTVVGLDKSRIGEWQRVSHTVSVTSPSNVYFYLISYGGTDNGTGNPDWSSWDVTMPQIEAKSSATPFVDGTRAGNLLGLNSNTTGSLINGPTYNTDNGGNITFDGTNDYIELNTNNIITGTNPFSFECWYTITAVNGGGQIFGNYGSGYTTNYLWISGEYGIYINGAVYFPGYPLTSGTIHMVATRASNGATVLYRNGVQVNSGTLNGSIPAVPNFRIGADTTSAGGVGAERLNGKIYLQRVYNRVLSAEEVLQNFNATRRRFGV